MSRRHQEHAKPPSAAIEKAHGARAGSPGGAGRGSLFASIGTSGLKKSGGYVSADFINNLNGRQAAEMYKEMAWNDAILHGITFAVRMLLRSVEWRMDPADESAAAKEYAQWAWDDLRKRCESRWSNVISNAAEMVTFGFSPLEMVFRKREDGRIGVHKLDLRAQETIERWEWDAETDELLGFWQQDWIRPSVFIPMSRVLHFRTEDARGNPEGRSCLRASYKYYQRKKAIEEAEGRAALRAAGIAVMDVPIEILSASASEDMKQMRTALQGILEKIAKDQQGGIMLPSNPYPTPQGALTSVPMYQLRFITADGRRGTDFSALINRMDTSMAVSLLADFVLLGHQQVGSKALSTDKTQIFTAALAGFCDMIADEFNRKLIPLWWNLNGWPDETRPTLAYEKLQKEDLGPLGALLAQLIPDNVITPDDVLEDHVRSKAGLPKRSAKGIRAPRAAEGAKQAAPDRPRSGGDNADAEEA
jgi:hypothetical protein